MDNEVVPQLNKKAQTETFELKPAVYGSYYTKDTALGGVYVPPDCGLKIGERGSIDEGALKLCPARRKDFGGIIISDGLERQYGTYETSVRIGKGLHYAENDTTKEGYYDTPGDGLISGISEHDRDRLYRGRAIEPLLGNGLGFADVVDENGIVTGQEIALDIGSGITFEEHADSEGIVTYRLAANIGDGLMFEEYTDENGDTLKRIVPNIGENLELGADGKINAKGGSTLTPGDGVDIQNDVIRVKVDGDTVKFNDNKELIAAGGVVIDKAVIIKEAEAKHILHNFTQVEYMAGNKIGYAGPGNQIIVGGYVFYKSLPDITALGSAPYTSAVFAKAGMNASAMYENFDLYVEYIRITSSNQTFVVYSDALSTSGKYVYISSNYTYNMGKTGIGFVWAEIYQPSADHPNGYVAGRVYELHTDSAGNFLSRGSNVIYAEFASMAEYEAAVGLTYEPLTLTRVEDNPTIV